MHFPLQSWFAGGYIILRLIRLHYFLLLEHHRKSKHKKEGIPHSKLQFSCAQQADRLKTLHEIQFDLTYLHGKITAQEYLTTIRSTGSILHVFFLNLAKGIRNNPFPFLTKFIKFTNPSDAAWKNTSRQQSEYIRVWVCQRCWSTIVPGLCLVMSKWAMDDHFPY